MLSKIEIPTWQFKINFIFGIQYKFCLWSLSSPPKNKQQKQQKQQTFEANTKRIIKKTSSLTSIIIRQKKIKEDT